MIEIIVGMMFGVLVTAKLGLLRGPIRTMKNKELRWKVIRLIPIAMLLVVYAFLWVLAHAGLEIVYSIFIPQTTKPGYEPIDAHRLMKTNLLGVGSNTGRLYDHTDIEYFKSKAGWL